jgi:hypothetical protein
MRPSALHCRYRKLKEFQLKLELFRKLEREAKRNGRSNIRAEIVARLQDSFAGEVRGE